MSSVRRFLTWCILASLAMASVEALGYCLTQQAGTGLSLAEFALCFSGTFCLLLLLNCVAGVAVWFFLIWLGGVRWGMALFFMLFAFVLFGAITLSVDILFKYTTRLSVFRPVVVMQAGYFSLIVACLVSLILGKVNRRSNPAPVSARWFAMLAFSLTGAAVAAWARGGGLVQDLAWAGVLATFGATLVFLWWFNKSPRRLGFLVGTSCLALLAPLPWVFSGPPAPVSGSATASGPHPVRHIILVTVDTLRRDSLGCYTPGSSNSPNIDQLAQSGAVFANAFSCSPWTLPSVASIQTGMTPHVHQLQEAAAVLPDNLPTLAEYLKNAGYKTGAVGWNAHLGPVSKLDRGFQEYNWFPAKSITAKTFDAGLSHRLLGLLGDEWAPATTLTDHAIDWVTKNAQQDFFFWVHYLDPHMPYTPPEQFQPTDPKQLALGRRFWDLQRARTGHTARTAEERTWIRTLYDGEVRYVDSEMGRLIDALKKLGIYEDTLIVLTADHGEEFWDHDRFEHGHTLYNELVRVPLVVKLPKAQQASTVEAYVGTQAILPSVLDLCAVAPKSTSGLLPSFSQLLQNPYAAFSEGCLYTGACIFGDHQEGVIFDRMKYTRSRLSGHEMLFNLAEDPMELNSLVAQDPDNLARGRRLLEEAVAAAGTTIQELGVGKGIKDTVNVDVQKLQSMGYL